MKRNTKTTKNLLKKLSSPKLLLIFTITLFGVISLLLVKASTNVISVEPEDSASANFVVSDASASGGQAVKFNNIPTTGSCTSFPNANCTGVPAGVTLTAYDNSISNITVAGTVIDSKDIKTCLNISANNVTIKRSKFTAGSQCSGRSVISINNGATGTLVEGVEINGLNVNSKGDAICCSNFTARSMNIYNVGSGFNIKNNTIIENSYIHDLYEANSSHNDAIVSNGGTNIVIRNNNLEVPLTQTTPLALYGDFTQIKDVLVENNLLNGGGYCIYGGSVSGKPFPLASNVTIKNNHFGRKFYNGCGTFGPVTSWASGNGNTWINNIWDDTGQPVNP